MSDEERPRDTYARELRSWVTSDLLRTVEDDADEVELCGAGVEALRFREAFRRLRLYEASPKVSSHSEDHSRLTVRRTEDDGVDSYRRYTSVSGWVREDAPTVEDDPLEWEKVSDRGFISHTDHGTYFVTQFCKDGPFSVYYPDSSAITMTLSLVVAKEYAQEHYDRTRLDVSGRREVNDP